MGCNSKHPFCDYVTSGVATIVVNAILAASTNYFWEIIDQFGKKHFIPFTTDEDGKGNIDTTELPDGFVNPAMGTFAVRVKRDINSCDYESMIIPVSFEAIHVDVVASNEEKNQLGCTTDLSASSGGVGVYAATITEETAGNTVEIPDAKSILAILRSVSDEEFEFDPETHILTFTQALTPEEKLRVIYIRQ